MCVGKEILKDSWRKTDASDSQEICQHEVQTVIPFYNLFITGTVVKTNTEDALTDDTEIV